MCDRTARRRPTLRSPTVKDLLARLADLLYTRVPPIGLIIALWMDAKDRPDGHDEE